jgi:threonine/homoserine/homoserine lactone efflux protein
MASIETLLAFALTTTLFAFLPGPAMLYAAAHVMAGGRQAGLKAVLGIHIGAYAHVFATAAGLAVLLHAVPVLYTLIKFAGAAYLIWLGIGLMRGTAQRNEHGQTAAQQNKLSQSIAVELLNPKTALFFLAFLPQFVDPTAAFPIWIQLAILGFVVNALFTLADVIVVLMADQIVSRMKKSSFIQGVVQRIGGSILISMGADLMLRRQ